MRRFTVILVVFMAGFVCFDAAMVLIGGALPAGAGKYVVRYARSEGDFMSKRLEDAHRTAAPDILFFGSSHCYRSFDPRIFKKAGYTIFNFGSSMQTPLQTEMFATHFLDSIRPRAVVLEVYPEIFCNSGVESACNLVSMQPPDRSMLAMVVKVNSMMAYNTMFYAMIRRAFPLDRSLQPLDGNTYVDGGFVESAAGNRSGRQAFPPKAYVWNRKQLDAFDRVIKELKRRHLPYVLVQAPMPADFYGSKINNREADSLLASKGKYINFNKIMALDAVNDFMDGDHLNQGGVEKFNSLFIAMLGQRKIFPAAPAGHTP